jgi:hypothetical protein
VGYNPGVVFAYVVKDSVVTPPPDVAVGLKLTLKPDGTLADHVETDALGQPVLLG